MFQNDLKVQASFGRCFDTIQDRNRYLLGIVLEWYLSYEEIRQQAIRVWLITKMPEY